jgi:hypothetical protein
MSLIAATSVSFEGIKTNIINTASGAYEKIGPIALTALKFYSLYSMYESALSDILCLKTFRHGTSPYAVASITLRGPNHELAGKGGEAAFFRATTGEDSAYAARDQFRKAFYVVEDISSENNHKSVVANYLYPKLVAKGYSLRTTCVSFTSLMPLPKKWKGALIQKVVEHIESGQSDCAVFGFFCPTVKFHINPDRINSLSHKSPINFERDHGGGDGAMFTKDRFSVRDVGLLGVLNNGINSAVLKRIKDNRGQFIWGIAQLVMAIAFTTFFFPTSFYGIEFTEKMKWILYPSTELEKVVTYVFAAIIFPPLAYAGFQL